MTNEHGMSPAEFKTAHESLGVSTAFLAERIGVSSGRIWAYEATDRTLPVPDHAAAIMRQLVREFEEVAAGIARDGKLAGLIERQADLAAFESTWPTMAGWGPLAQGLAIARAADLAQLPVEYA